MPPRLHQSLLFGLSMLLATSSCRLTMSELTALNPSAATLEVHCRPGLIPDKVKRFALDLESGHIVTDEHQDELRSYARLASVFIEVNPGAPIANAQVMASEYGLSCPHMTLPDARYLAQPAESSSGGARTSLPRIAVCARPPGITVNEWHGGPGIKGTSTTTNAAEYAKETAKATVIYYFDANAPAESVWNFGKETKIRCPGQAPIPYDQWVAANTNTSSAKTGSTNAGTPAKTGSSAPTSTSSAEGKGPPLDPIEAAIRELALAGALAQGDTSGSLKDPQGARHGIPGGKNVGGFSFPPLQAGVAAIQVISAVGLSPKAFVKKVAEAASKGQRTVIKELDESALQLADQLIQEHGQYVMAESMRKAQVIMPFKMAQKFTAGLESKFQAHKIFERRAIEQLMNQPGMSQEAIKKAVDEVAKKYPAIILTDADHKVISAKLAAAWKGKEKNMTKQELRAIYKKVYEEYPHWMAAIDSYLR